MRMMNSRITIGLIMGGLMFSSIGYAVSTKPLKQKQTQKQKQQRRLKINPITEDEDAWMANAETDVYRVGSFENITLGYSAKNGWDLNLLLVNSQILGSNKQFQGDMFFNIAKTFAINPVLSITVGLQNGIAVANQQPHLWFNYTFLDGRYDVTPWLLLHGGSYFANASLTGTARQVGFITGTEITFIPHQLSLQMDYVSGHQSLSGATVNMLLNLTPHWQMYMGVYVPEQNSGNEFAGLIGFNLSTKCF
jgi:hypothetical protein